MVFLAQWSGWGASFHIFVIIGEGNDVVVVVVVVVVVMVMVVGGVWARRYLFELVERRPPPAARDYGAAAPSVAVRALGLHAAAPPSPRHDRRFLPSLPASLT
ncbi:hypothetical protein E2C01_004519 [Portunus trituberculatus]|uniref:Uncharacterized protein n=1 Tax=Portunus trituberculatus TaxID=210409 RepID=A0A5B7CWL4_PORTR|nr:hypothetical protein [Portunus trituberculatus]